MDCKDLHYSRHAFERMFQRDIDPDAVAQVVASGEVIADYPETSLTPALCCWAFTETSRCMQSLRTATGECHLVTIYWPDPAIWDRTFRKRIA